MGIGFREILIILLVVLVVFGSRRLPDIMKDFAKGIQSFKEGLNGVDEKESSQTLEKKESSDDSSKNV